MFPSAFVRPLASCTTLLLAVLASATAISAQDKSDFERGITRYRNQMERGRWGKAERELRDLLEEHAKQPYAVERRTELMEDLKRCIFRAQAPDLDADAAASGEVRKHKERSNQVEVVYTKEQLKGDWESAGEATLHGAVWSNDVELSVEIERYQGQSVQMIFDLGADVSRRAQFTPAEANLMFIRNSKVQRTGSAGGQVKLKNGKPAIFTLKVRGRKAELLVNRKSICEVTRDAQAGQLGLFVPEDFDRIVISGTTDGRWIESLLAGRYKELEKEFDKTFDREKAFPEWLLNADIVAGGPQLDGKLGTLNELLPAAQTQALGEAIQTLNQHLNNERWEAALKDLDSRLKESMEPALWHTFRARFLELAGRYSPALDELEKAQKEDDEAAVIPLMRGRIYNALGKHDLAREVLDELLETWPNLQGAVYERVMAEMFEGQLEAAGTVFKQGRSAGARGGRMDMLDSMLLMAGRGPNWSRVYEFSQSGVDVKSDADRTVCRNVVKSLRVILEHCERNYGRIQGKADPLRIYVFASRKGYNGYMERLPGGPIENSAGVYMPYMRQMLMWLGGGDDQFFKTARHESVHAYVHQRFGGVTRWWNEGLAEFLEIGGGDAIGRLDLGNPNPYHIRILNDAGLQPMEKFINLAGKEFMANAGTSYAQSWLIMDMLHTGDRKWQQLGDRLVKAWERDEDPYVAQMAAFEGIDLKVMDQALKDHLYAKESEMRRGR